MQKTQNLDLNLLEGHDALDPAALNDNAQALDAVITADRAAIAAKADATSVADLAEQLTAAVGSIGTHGYNCRMVWGSYTGDGAFGADNPTHLAFGLYPILVMVSLPGRSAERSRAILLRRDATYTHPTSSGGGTIIWGDDCVDLVATSASLQFNSTSSEYCFLAFGYDA